MRARDLSFTTFNLLNLNEPGLPIYGDRDGWSEDVYARKIAWTRAVLDVARADVFGFQELWHGQSLANAFQGLDLGHEYRLLVPEGQAGERIICAGAVRADMLDGDPEWIADFPATFRLESAGQDPQTPAIAVRLSGFSRPVLHLKIRPRDDREPVHVYVCHFKSKAPTPIHRESWYEAGAYSRHAAAIGGALSTVRRTAEATALRLILNERMKDTKTPVVVLGDLNDGVDSNTLDILTTGPRYLTALSQGGGDTALYSGQTLQEYRSRRDVYYTYIHEGAHGSLDHILVSEEFYDNSRDRVWAFDGMDVYNDHLNRDDHKEDGTGDHGVARARFVHRPAKG